VTPPNSHQYDRRRAEDVFRVVEEEVFPRLGAIDTKISSLEQGVNKISLDGCAHRQGDLLRTQRVETNTEKIFDKIEDLGNSISEAAVDMVKQVGDIKTDVAKQVGGIKAWVLTGVVIILLSVASFFLQKHYDMLYSDRDRPAAANR